MNKGYMLRDVECFTRFVIGFLIVLSLLVLPLNPGQIVILTLLAIYPLMTALIAIDPLFFVISQFAKAPKTALLQVKPV